MYGLVVRFELAPGREGDFDALVASTLEGVANEPGTIMYVPHAVIGEPTARIFYEVYRDEEAFLAHERQAHTVRFLRDRSSLLAGPPRVEFVYELPNQSQLAPTR